MYSEFGLLNSNDLWLWGCDLHKNNGFFHSQRYISTQSLRYIHIYKMSLDFDLSWPCTSTKRNTVHVFAYLHLHTTYEFQPSFKTLLCLKVFSFWPLLTSKKLRPPEKNLATKILRSHIKYEFNHHVLFELSHLQAICNIWTHTHTITITVA